MRRLTYGFVALCVVAALVIIALAFRPAFAQSGGTIQYGATLIGRLSPDIPLLLYNFDGAAGDHIRVRALASTGNLNPSLALIGADQQPLTASSDNPFSGNPDDASFAYTLPETATYGLLVSTTGENAEGEFVLQIALDSPAIIIPLTFDATTPVQLEAGNGSQRYGFTSDLTCTTLLTTRNTAADNAPYALRLYDNEGNLIGQGSRAAEDRFYIAPNSGDYVVDISSVVSGANVALTLSLGCAASGGECSTIPADAPVFAAPVFAPPAGPVLMVQSGGFMDYGDAVINSVIEDTPLVSYTFSGAAGDVITAEAIGISFEFNPSLALLSPSMQPISYNDNAPLGFGATDAALTATLPEDGTYALLVGAEGFGGTFWLRLNNTVMGEAAPLPPNTMIGIDEQTLDNAAGTPLLYAFETGDCTTALSLINIGEGFPFTVIVRDASGTIFTGLREGQQQAHLITLPPNSGRYIVEIIPLEGGAERSLAISASCASEHPVCVGDLAFVNALLTQTPTAELTADGTALTRTPTRTPTRTVTLRGTPTRTPTPLAFITTTPRPATRTPTAVPPTAVPPTAVPPTAVPPTAVPPTAVPPTAVPPTAVPPTAVPPTAVPPTAVPPTAVPPTAVPPFCGDGVCNGGENICSCPSDNCPPIVVFCNNNGTCECGETCGSCPFDCGLCLGP
jgi:hypothetical protein